MKWNACLKRLNHKKGYEENIVAFACYSAVFTKIILKWKRYLLTSKSNTNIHKTNDYGILHVSANTIESLRWININFTEKIHQQIHI